MSTLKDRLKRQIKLTGPISIADYWAQCLFDPIDGYYTSREPFGTSGDFITAPEISQMFGELLAAWWLTTVRTNDLRNCSLVEIGPGRATLMADMLRTLEKLAPDLASTLSVHMIETSPRLTAIQEQKLQESAFSITWHETIATLPAEPVGIIANELFDAIPIRQFVKTETGWFENCVSLDVSDNFYFATGTTKLDATVLPKFHENQTIGTLFEYAPAREALMSDLAHHIKLHGGFGLFIDYGHIVSAFGDTLQALKKHKFISLLEDQGLVDITSHVDFESLSKAAAHNGLLTAQIITQGEFLTRLGIERRTQTLSNASPTKRETFVTACERLTHSSEMGNLFKVLAVSNKSIILPAFEIAS